MYVNYSFGKNNISQNKELFELVSNNLKDISRGGARVTDFNFHKRGYSLVENLTNAIMNIVPLAVYNITTQKESLNLQSVLERNKNNPHPFGGGEDGFDLTAFKISECWGVVYDNNDSLMEHNHFPYALSFCYYVNVPDNSSSLIIEDEEVIVSNGTIVIFPGYKNHSVLPNNSNGRCCIVGNLTYMSITE